MKPLSIRLKLTAWYVAILLASLSIFGIAAFFAMKKGIAAFFAMKKGIETSVDENLEGQAAGIEELMGRVPNEEPTHLRDELREHAELREQADFSQVCDEGGHWIYRSRLMASHDVPVPATASYSAYNLEAKGLPLRVMVREINAGGDRYRIQVAAPMDDFYDAIDRFKWVVLLISHCRSHPRIRRWVLVEPARPSTRGSNYPSSSGHQLPQSREAAGRPTEWGRITAPFPDAE